MNDQRPGSETLGQLMNEILDTPHGGVSLDHVWKWRRQVKDIGTADPTAVAVVASEGAPPARYSVSEVASYVTFLGGHAQLNKGFQKADEVIAKAGAVSGELEKQLQQKANQLRRIYYGFAVGDWRKSLKEHPFPWTYAVLAEGLFILNKNGQEALNAINIAVSQHPSNEDYQKLQKQIQEWAGSFKGSWKLLIGLGVFALGGIVEVFMGIVAPGLSLVILFGGLAAGYWFWKKQ